MNDDKALLEAAAKAAGVDVVGYANRLLALPNHDGSLIVRHAAGGDVEWNPIADDGDALRLAVKLRFSMHYETQFLPGGEMIDTVEVFYDRDPESGQCKVEMLPLGNDPEAATRRSIVRAAASLGQEAKHG